MAYDRNGTSGAIPRSVFWLMAIWVLVLLSAVVWGVDNAEATLREEARASFDETDYNVAVDISGRDARLIGIVDDEAVSSELSATIGAIDGIRLVNNEIVVVEPEPPPLMPPDITVRLVGDAVVLRGAVPSEAVATALVDAAAEVYGSDRVVNDLDVGPNVESDEWLAFVPGVFEHLEALRSGGFSADRGGLHITGEVVSEVARDQIVAGTEVVIGDQLRVTADLTIALLPPPSFAAELTGGILLIEGTMPDQDTVDRIVDAAERLHPNATVIDALTRGEVAGPMWLESIEGLLDIVSRLDAWTIQVDQDTVTIAGFGSDADVVSAVDVVVAEVVGGDLVAVVAVEVEPTVVAAQLTGLVEGADLFEPGTATLTAEGTTALDAAAELLIANPSTVLVVEGHTDNLGNAAANLELSQLRAEAVVDNLVSAGIGPARLTAIGFGGEQPIASNATAEGRAQNTRIVFVFTGGNT